MPGIGAGTFSGVGLAEVIALAEGPRPGCRRAPFRHWIHHCMTPGATRDRQAQWYAAGALFVCLSSWFVCSVTCKLENTRAIQLEQTGRCLHRECRIFHTQSCPHMCSHRRKPYRPTGKNQRGVCPEVHYWSLRGCSCRGSSARLVQRFTVEVGKWEARTSGELRCLQGSSQCLHCFCWSPLGPPLNLPPKSSFSIFKVSCGGRKRSSQRGNCSLKNDR